MENFLNIQSMDKTGMIKKPNFIHGSSQVSLLPTFSVLRFYILHQLACFHALRNQTSRPLLIPPRKRLCLTSFFSQNTTDSASLSNYSCLVMHDSPNSFISFGCWDIHPFVQVRFKQPGVLVFWDTFFRKKRNGTIICRTSFF